MNEVFTNESPSFRQENLPQLQDRATPGRGPCDLHRHPAQAAAGLIARTGYLLFEMAFFRYTARLSARLT
jgi:hypothetical protein